MSSHKELKNIIDKFPKNEVNLASHKVELSFVQDIQKLIREIQDVIDQAYKDEDEINGEINQIEIAKERLLRQLSASESNAQELKVGSKVEIADLKGRMAKAAGELGIDINDIKGMTELNALEKEAPKVGDYLNGLIKKAAKMAK
jgi:chromosome segregation ATPase